MAFDKMVDSELLDSNLKSIADAIRAKTEKEDLLAFPDGFVEQIGQISSGGQVETKKLIYNEILFDDIGDSHTAIQIKYAMSNYSSDVYPTTEDYLMDTSIVIHSGEEIDTSKELVTVTIFPNQESELARACLAVNLNGVLLTDNFTITKTDEYIYTVSANFTLNPEEDMAVDVVYVPSDWGLLLPPTFYRTDLYDDCNSTDSMDARLVDSLTSVTFDETLGKVSVKSGSIRFYIDAFETLNTYTMEYISMIQRLSPEWDWTKWDITKSKLFSMLEPCFIPAEYWKVTDNLTNSVSGSVYTNYNEGTADNRDVYPFYIRENPGVLYTNGLSNFGNDRFDLDTMNYLTPPLMIMFMLPSNDDNGWDSDYVESLWEDEENAVKMMMNAYSIVKKLQSLDAVKYFCAEAVDSNEGMTATVSNTFGWSVPSKAIPLRASSHSVSMNKYDFINKFYLPKDGTDEMRRYTFTDETEEYSSLCLSGNAIGTSTYTTTDDKYLIVVPTTHLKLNDKIYAGEDYQCVPPFCSRPFTILPNVEIGG